MAKPKTVLVDELHVAVRVPANLSQDKRDEIRTVLDGDEFMTRLRQAIRATCRAFPALIVVRVSFTR
jgi:hypothetical protein